MQTKLALTILYVADLPRAAAFYDAAFASAFYDAAFAFEKTVEVPVYVEYELNPGARLGLMPQANTRHFLGAELGSRTPSDSCPRGEIYLHVADIEAVVARLKKLGAVCTSPLTNRDWGDRAAYFLDADDYVIAVGEKL